MMIPSMVSTERILWARMACTDILNASTNWSLRKRKEAREEAVSSRSGWGRRSRLRVSEMIAPSLISMIRLAKAAMW